MMRSKKDFLNQYSEYIESLVGEDDLTDEELKDFIKMESEDYHEELSEKEIEWLVEEVSKRQRACNKIWTL